jgi:hypothetical protein
MWNLLLSAAVLLSVWVAPSDAQTPSPSFFTRSSVAVAAKFSMQVSVTDLGLKSELPPIGKRVEQKREFFHLFSPSTSQRARCASQSRPTRSPTMTW